MKSQDEQWLLREKYNGEKTEAFYADCKALALGEPLAYLIGHTPFLDCTIHLDGRPLVPRVETEFWVEKAIVAIKESRGRQPNLFEDGQTPASAETRSENTLSEDLASGRQMSGRSGSNILDLCAGSGCIGVAVTKAVAEARVDFSEIDARLLPTIEKNVAKNIADTAHCAVFHSNLFAGLPSGKKYDFILSNPPYIDPALNRVDESVKDFEPHLALFGGKAGMQVIEQLIAAAPDHLTPSGQLWIEHEPEQAGAIAIVAQENNFSISHHPDQYDVVRYSILVLQ